MANGVEGASASAREADRLALKAQLDDMRRRLILMESKLVEYISIVEDLRAVRRGSVD